MKDSVIVQYPAPLYVVAKKKISISKTFLYSGLILLAIICVIPFYLMIIYSTHNNSEIASKFLYYPGSSLLDNYHRMQSQIDIWRGFLNSAFISITATVLSGYFGALTAFGFAKYKFKFNKQLFLFVLGTMMIPGQLGLIGYYKLISTLGLLDTYWPLILPSIANAYAAFFIREFINSAVPDEIIESARIDGYGEFNIFNRIIIPIIMPAIAALSIFSFIGSWNNFLSPLVLLFSKDMFPLPVLVAMIKGYYSTDYGTMYLGVAISVVPIILVFMFASKKIIGGLTVGAVKG